MILFSAHTRSGILAQDSVDEDSGDKYPLVRIVSRRQALRLMGIAATATLLRYGREQPAPASAAGVPACVVRPEQTEGPYFVDAKLNRSDIRSEPSDGSLAPGVPLRLSFQVSRVDGGSCSPLDGAIVDIWQCDALGVYSGVRDLNAAFDARQKIFLRGYQTTNARGSAEFLTIYPGWYEGRAVHIHFKIRAEAAARRAYEFTSQLYFDDAISDQVHRLAPYNTKRGRRTTNDADFGYRRGGRQLIPAFTRETQGYSASFDIGLRIS